MLELLLPMPPVPLELMLPTEPTVPVVAVPVVLIAGSSDEPELRNFELHAARLATEAVTARASTRR